MQNARLYICIEIMIIYALARELFYIFLCHQTGFGEVNAILWLAIIDTWFDHTAKTKNSTALKTQKCVHLNNPSQEMLKRIFIQGENSGKKYIT